MSNITQDQFNSPLNKIFKIAESEYNLAPRPPILGEKDNLKSPKFGGFRGHYNKRFSLDLFYPLRRWMDSIEVTNDKFAHFLCNLIPCSCPFERDITIFGRTFHIPALCKINPLYNEVVRLRLRALNYLQGDLGEDVTKYIC